MAEVQDRVQTQVIEIDNDITETESGYGDELSAYTTSVTSSVTDYRQENGRTYHGYRDGRYLVPNDDRESDRLDLHHELIRNLLHGKSHLAPVGENPQRILDLCTGTGIWAVDIADEFPSAEVIGNDLSPTQPSLIPPNLKFIVDDVEDDWGYETTPFDYVHGRYLSGSLKDLPKLVQQAYNCTKPGGWFEIQDWNPEVYSNDNTVEDTAVYKYLKIITGAFAKQGYECQPGRQAEKWMKEAGFINVQAKKFPIPLGTWPKDKHYKKVGALNLLQVEEGLEAASMAVLTRFENWKPEEVTVTVAQARKDARNPNIHGQFDFYVVYGQKPA